jgi:uncharacterized protein YycO
MINVTPARVGDVLLYGGTSLFDEAIEWRTMCGDVSHVECFAGNASTWTAKPESGVNFYAFTEENLRYVLRPQVFNADAAWKWFQPRQGLPYGWDAIANFEGVNFDCKSYVCSTTVAALLRAAYAEVLSDHCDLKKVYPGAFLFIPKPSLTLIYDYRNAN